MANTPYTQGRMAWHELNKGTNPYLSGTKESIEWINGWMDEDDIYFPSHT